MNIGLCKNIYKVWFDIYVTISKKISIAFQSHSAFDSSKTTNTFQADSVHLDRLVLKFFSSSIFTNDVSCGLHLSHFLFWLCSVSTLNSLVSSQDDISYSPHSYPVALLAIHTIYLISPLGFTLKHNFTNSSQTYPSEPFSSR